MGLAEVQSIQLVNAYAKTCHKITVLVDTTGKTGYILQSLLRNNGFGS